MHFINNVTNKANKRTQAHPNHNQNEHTKRQNKCSPNVRAEIAQFEITVHTPETKVYEE